MAKQVSDGINEIQLESQLARVIEAAKSKGASASEAALSMQVGLSAAVRLGEVETLEYNRDRGLAITVYFDGCKGSASTSDLSDDSIDRVVEHACNIAKFTACDEFAGLADKEQMAEKIVDLDTWYPWDISAEQVIDLAIECETTARELDDAITNSEGADVSSHQGVSVYANSHGFIGKKTGTRHSISCCVLASQDEAMERDYWYTIARDASDLESPTAVGKKAAERALRRCGARQVKTCQAPVLFSPEVASGVISHFISAISGGNLYRKTSFLVDHLGKTIFPDFFELKEDPYLLKALGSACFDNEGVQTEQRAIVSGGVLEGYVLGSYSARKLGMKSTGNAGGVHNLLCKPSQNYQDMVKQIDRGLLVTEVMGQGINITTGDYSRGASGFWIENGEIQFPVNEVTIASNLKDMFKQMVAVGDDIDHRGNIRIGSILIEQMTIAGE